MPVPGGTDDVNETCFNSIADMQARVMEMTPGMPEGQVLTNLCRKKENLTRLDDAPQVAGKFGGITFRNLNHIFMSG